MRHLRARADGDTQRTARLWLSSPSSAAIAGHLATVAMWCLVACGPLALLAVAGSHTRSEPAASAGTSASASSGIGPGGFAELYVATYLAAGAGSSQLQSFFPDPPDITSQKGSRQVTATAVVSVTQVSPGYWSVIVATDEEANIAGHPAGLHYFLVPVLAAGSAASGGTGNSGSQPSYVATALPAEIAAPAQAAEPQLGYNTTIPVESRPLTSAVTQFLASYLTGSGNLSRYLAPGTNLSPVSPVPYASIQAVTVFSTGSQPTTTGEPPASSTRLNVLAQVDATDKSGHQWPLTYALTLAAVAGQWDVAAIDPAPQLGPSQ
jgi:hypothetical protein